MRIVRYYPRAVLGDGGITNSVWCHSQELVRLGVDVTVAFDGGVPPAGDGIDWRAVRHLGGGPARVPVGLEDVLEGADLLVLHSAWALHNVRAGQVARKTGVPYLLEPRGAYDPRIVRRKAPLKRAWWLAWERKLVLSARAVHVFFDEQKAAIEALGYAGRWVVAPNGIELPAARWDGGSGGYVLWYGRYDPEHKGIDLLLRALRVLPAVERPRLRLHGPDARIGGKDEMRRLVEELGLEPWVELGGPVHGDEKYDILSRAIGFVYPSRWEGFGNAVAEAAAVGVPTVTTPYPLGKHLAARGGAVVVEPTPIGLAEGLRRLASLEAAEIGARGRAAIGEMTWERVARSWLDQVEAAL